MQAPTGSTQASQSSAGPAPQAPTGSNTVDKALDTIDKGLDLTNTLAAIVKEVAEVLNHAPFVKTLTGVILQFIKIKDELKTNKARCLEIVEKVINLSHWICDKLLAIGNSGEWAKENLAQVEGSLVFCARTLANVLGELKQHQARPMLAKLVSRGVEDLNKVDRSVDDLRNKLLMDMVFDIRMQQGMPVSGENMDPASHPSAEGHDDILPPKPYLIVERDEQIDIALGILLSAEPSRIAILGGGGFGKTTLARALLHDPKIAERYQSRYFLSCEAFTDADTLLLGIGSMFDIKASPTAMLASIRRRLETSTTLLCLDNFETPWEPSANRTKVEELLASIADISKLSLIITTRGTQRPSKVAWSHPLLPPLSTISSESARKVLQTICGPDFIIDEPTQNLLDAVDGIPLAITLISNLLRDGELSRSLWNRWLKQETKIVENGGDDRESNLNTSIALSVSSPRMKKDPGAIALLAALSLLPDGFAFASVEQLRKYLNIHKAIQTLQVVALIKPNEPISSPRIQMLSPIRLFCLSVLSSKISLVLEKVVDYYIGIMLQAQNNLQNAELYAQVVPEIQNIHSVFQRVFKVGYSQDITRLINATVYLTDWSCYIGYLSQNTIQMALETSINFPIPHADCLMSLGHLYFTEGHDAKAETYFREAAALYKQAKNVDGEAEALLRSGEVLFYSGQLEQSEVEVAFKTSLELFTKTGNKWGQARVCQGLENLYTYHGQYSKAQATLLDALEAYQQISYSIGLANVAQILSDLHFNLGNLVEAEKYATEALSMTRRANHANGEGNALGTLARIYLALDRVPDARQALEEALMIFKRQNDSTNQLNAINDLAAVYIQSDQLSLAEALLTASSKVELDLKEIPDILATLGWLYICGDCLDKAEPFLDDALQRFPRFNGKYGQATVLGHLGSVYFKTNRLDKAEQVLKSIPDLGKWITVEIHRLWVLGDLYIVKGELEDAETSLDAALARCQNRQKSYSYQQGNILCSMGTLHVKRNRADLAIDKFKEAREFHCKAQWVSEQAIDLKRLGEAYTMLERAEEAEEAFREADELMESVREARTLRE